jgi:hypothetical protein
MAFRRADLQEAFFVPGGHAFRVYGYGTTDRLEEVLRPGYFALARGQLRPGELIYVSIAKGSNDGTGEPRMALVMVQKDARDAGVAGGSVRLVQDFGGPGDPARPTAAEVPTPPTPVKRGRGRPPGSRTRKPAPTSA